MRNCKKRSYEDGEIHAPILHATEKSFKLLLNRLEAQDEKKRRR
ncbi:hypothetical protein TcasGA2_TC031622 [Tribolium castaneum]|uniref:Uncharacterized protein n=1 Tax=Tribolium castaneum TaxID=7070 RepID=A0A139WAH9_TRICA|nr:hypothetical protein TcasGA2_TC031622 [Tribolium castaneum]